MGIKDGVFVAWINHCQLLISGSRGQDSLTNRKLLVRMIGTQTMCMALLACLRCVSPCQLFPCV